MIIRELRTFTENYLKAETIVLKRFPLVVDLNMVQTFTPKKNLIHS